MHDVQTSPTATTSNRDFTIDLAAYLERIRLPNLERSPSAPVLRQLLAAHSAAIPFENLDPRLRRPVPITLPELEDKLVRRRRGGYCFEQNTLFAAVLRQLGFEVDTLEARVRPPGAAITLPRTHMLLRVTLEGRPWLVDVGFGGDGPLVPVPLDGEVAAEPDGQCRVVTEGESRVLQRHDSGAWRDLYAFRLEPALPVDFEVANHFTSTHRRSIFLQTLTVQRSTAEARHILRARSYTRTGADPVTREGLDDNTIAKLLVEELGLEVPRSDVEQALAGL